MYYIFTYNWQSTNILAMMVVSMNHDQLAAVLRECRGQGVGHGLQHSDGALQSGGAAHLCLVLGW